MSSPGFGPFQPMMEDLRNKGSRAVNMLSAPGQTIHDFFVPPDPHQQAIQQMNQQMNAHRNDAANASFVHPQPQQSAGVLTQAAKRPRQ